jgi:hypothetical protein
MDLEKLGAAELLGSRLSPPKLILDLGVGARRLPDGMEDLTEHKPDDIKSHRGTWTRKSWGDRFP